MISFLCPSRERPEHLEASYQSVKDLDMEFLVAIDESEPQKEAYAKFKPLICPNYGYAYLDGYFNDLAKISKGDWLFLWNDDAIYQGGSLETDLDPHNPWVVIFGGDTRFPMISRGLYELVGHFTTGPSADSSICSVGQASKILVDLPAIQIKHDTIADGVTSRKYEASSVMVKRHKEVSTKAEADILKIL